MAVIQLGERIPASGLNRPPEKLLHSHMPYLFRKVPFNVAGVPPLYNVGTVPPLYNVATVLPLYNVARVPPVYNVSRLPPPDKDIPITHKAVLGSMAGMLATMILHPLDLVKIRMQLFPGAKPRTIVQMVRRVYNCEGRRGLYVGLTAGLLRQVTYTTTRLGVYGALYQNYKTMLGEKPTAKARLAIAVTAGLAGALAGTPSELALVRMTMRDRRRRSRCSPPCSPTCKKPRGRWGAIGKLYRIASADGIFAIWRGGCATCTRSIIVSIAQVSTYAEIRYILEELQLAEGMLLHVYASFWSSLITAVFSMPVDILKTRNIHFLVHRYQANLRNETMQQICKNILKEKGIKHFWKGFTPYFVRQVAHTSLTFIFLDHITKGYKDLKRVLK